MDDNDIDDDDEDVDVIGGCKITLMSVTIIITMIGMRIAVSEILVESALIRS